MLTSQSLGAMLRTIRIGLGLSMADVAAKTKFKAVVVGSYERGDRHTNVDRLGELLAFYGRRLEVLDDGDVIVKAAGGGASRVEYVVVYAWLGAEAHLYVNVADLAEAGRVSAAMPGSRIAYRTRTVSDLTYVLGGGS